MRVKAPPPPLTEEQLLVLLRTANAPYVLGHGPVLLQLEKLKMVRIQREGGGKETRSAVVGYVALTAAGKRVLREEFNYQ